MKKTIIIFLGFFPLLCFGQDLKKDLQGKWICNKIIDSLNIETVGKFGKSGKYLQFKFYKSSLTILEAPFDRGLIMDFDLNKKDSTIDLFPNAIYELPERKYRVKYLSTKYLILKTSNSNKQSIFYVFTKQDEFVKDLKDSTLIDCGTIIIKHLKLDEKSNGANRVAEYLIESNSSLFYPTPYFDDYASANLGHFISINFKFPNNYPTDSLSNELIAEFYVSDKGAENIHIINGLDETTNQNILKILENSRKKWKPVIVDKKPVIVKIRLHMFFYLGLSELLKPFK